MITSPDGFWSKCYVLEREARPRPVSELHWWWQFWHPVECYVRLTPLLHAVDCAKDVLGQLRRRPT